MFATTLSLLAITLALGLPRERAESQAATPPTLDAGLRRVRTAPAGADNAPVPIAFLFDCTGAQGQLGQAALNGARLALQTVRPDAKGLMAVTEVNTATDSMLTRRAAERLCGLVRGAIGFTDSNSVLLAGPVLHREGRPLLSVGATDPCLNSDVGGDVFLTCFGDNAQGAAAADLVLERFGKRAAVLFDESSDYTRQLARFFRQAFAERGGDVVQVASCADSSGWGAAVAELAGSGRDFDALFVAVLPATLSEALGTIRDAGITAPIIGGDSFDCRQVLQSGVAPTSNVFFTTHCWLGGDGQTPAAAAFTRAWREAYGSEVPNAFAALGYDAANLMMDALRRARGPTAQDLAAALAATTDFKGVTGDISFVDGPVPHKDVWIVQVQDGARTLVGPRTPAKVPSPHPCK